MKTPALLAFLLVSVLPLGPQPLAQCPTNTWVGCGVPNPSTAPTYHSQIYGYECGYGDAWGDYNLSVGTLSVGANGWSDGGGHSLLTTEDIYSVLGPDLGSPIPLVALLTVSFSSSSSQNRYGFCSGSDGSAQLSGGGASKSLTFNAYGVCGWFSSSSVATLSLAYRVGEPFHLIANVDAGAGLSSSAGASGTLSFTLPPGYTVTSCQGYSSLPTAARPLSWGRLKSIYR